MNDLTLFQKQCQTAVIEKLGTIGISPFFCLDGERETYLKAIITVAKHTHEVFIYEDEAGFFKNKKWNIWEAEDYSSPGMLIEEFVSSLCVSILS